MVVSVPATGLHYVNILACEASIRSHAKRLLIQIIQGLDAIDSYGWGRSGTTSLEIVFASGNIFCGEGGLGMSISFGGASQKQCFKFHLKIKLITISPKKTTMPTDTERISKDGVSDC